MTVTETEVQQPQEWIEWVWSSSKNTVIIWSILELHGKIPFSWFIIISTDSELIGQEKQNLQGICQKKVRGSGLTP